MGFKPEMFTVLFAIPRTIELTHAIPHSPTRLAGDRTQRWANTHLPKSSSNCGHSLLPSGRSMSVRGRRRLYRVWPPPQRTWTTLRTAPRKMHDQGDEPDGQEYVNQAPGNVEDEPAEEPGDKTDNEYNQKQ
jgi:hypothetical protein